MAKNKIPKFLANPSESSRKIAKGLENDATNELHLQAQQIQMDMDDVKVTRLNNRIQIEKKMEENNIVANMAMHIVMYAHNSHNILIIQ